MRAGVPLPSPHLAKIPARCCLIELLLKEAKSHAWPEAVHWLSHLPHVPIVFLLIRFRELLVLSARRVYELHRAFKDHRFRRVIAADHALRVRREIARLARLHPGAEPEAFIEPQTPDDHQMWCAVGTGSCDPILPALL